MKRNICLAMFVLSMAAACGLRAQSNCLTYTCAGDKTVSCGTAWSFDPPTNVVNTCCEFTNYALTVLSTVTNSSACTNQAITRTWEITVCGDLHAQCQQTVFVINNNQAVFQGATNISVVSCSNVPVYYNITASEVCCGTLNVVCTPPSGSLFPPGVSPVECVAGDCCGRSFTNIFYVGVIHTNPPVFQGVSTIVVTSCSDTPVYYNPTASEDCCGPLTVVCTPPSGTTFHLGQLTQVSCVVTDCFGQTYTTNFYVLVNGGTYISLTCIDKSVICGTAWNYDVPMIYDPCCPGTNYTIGYEGPFTNGIGACAQTNSITWVITDECGNSNNCTQFVTILDSLALFPTNEVISCDSPVPTNPPAIVAGCCTNTTLSLQGSFTNNNGCGQIIYQVWQAVDCCSNTVTATNIITVLPAAPTIVCASNKVLGGSACSVPNGLPPFAVLHSFPGAGNVPPNDGTYPSSALLVGSDQALYGTTEDGGGYGQFGSGTIFTLNQDGTGYNLVHRFGGVAGDGFNPYGGVVEGVDGALYGTTTQNGIFGNGTIFSVHKDGTGFTVLYNFGSNATDGYLPLDALIHAGNGALYGTTSQGGDYSFGTVFTIQTNGLGYQVLYGFGGTNGDGTYPQGSLVIGPDGALYGTTASGGDFNQGTIFKINLDGTAYTLIYSFGRFPNDGREPEAGLIVGTDGALYGTTWSGGTHYSGSNQGGTVFKLLPSGLGYTVLYNFGSSAEDGLAPQASLIVGCDGALYGTTSSGGSGAGGLGTVFAINQDGTGYSILHSLDNNDGDSLLFGLVSGANGTLYGTAWNGGANGSGTVFQLPPSLGGFFNPPTLVGGCCGTNVTITVLGTVSTNLACGQALTRTWEIIDCCGQSNVCSQTVSFGSNTPPVLECSNLTVTCGSPIPTNPPAVYDPGCSNVTVTLISSTTNSAGCGQVISQVWQAIDCCSNTAVCTQLVTIVASPPVITCASNKTVACGTVWGFDPPFVFDTCCSNLNYFLLSSNLVASFGCKQVYDGVWLVSDCCSNSLLCTQVVTVVASPPLITCASNKTVLCGGAPAYSILQSFEVTNGVQPFSPVLNGKDGALYGTTSTGGYVDGGTVFTIKPDGTGFLVLHSFGTTTNDGQDPSGLCQDSQGNLYGTTFGGGDIGLGTVFKVSPNGVSYSILYSFGSNPNDGANPAAALIIGADGALYGSTFSGGAYEGGTIFRLQTDGTIETLRQLGGTPSDGTGPAGALIQAADGALYGTTAYGGGATEGGTVFTLHTDGSSYRVLHSFGSPLGDGINPYAGLVQGSERALYGTTAYGGAGGFGTVFTLDTHGNNYQILHSFSGSPTDALSPEAGLIIGSDGALYGTAFGDGADDAGGVFKVNPDGSDYSLVYSFGSTQEDGSGPLASLAIGSDGAFYGTTAYGGINSNGIIFRLTPSAPWSFDPPTVLETCCSNIAPVILSTVTNGTCPQVITRTWLIADCCSNSTVCTQMVTVVTPPPVLSCASLTIAAGSPVPTNPPTVLASCCTNVAVILTGAITNGGGCTNTIYQTWQAIDCCGQTTNCTRIITVLPSGPVFLCLDHLDIPCGAPVPTNAPAVFDLCCTNVSVSLISTLTNSVGCGEVIYQTWQAVDCNSNSALCTRIVTVSPAPPLVLCPSNKTVICGSCSSGSTPSPFALLHGFPVTNGDGELPGGGLLLGSEGALYGTTTAGGADNAGTVFALNRDGTGYTLLKSFLGTDGQNPLGTLAGGASDGALYGVTALGGSSNLGTVFTLNKNGGGSTVLKSFFGSDGDRPDALLVGKDGALYGATQYGGSNNYGAVFSLKASGAGFTVLHSFAGNNGYNSVLGPYVGLIQGQDGGLYGTTAYGGSSGMGLVFRLNTNGTGYTVLINLAGSLGQTPLAQLLQASDGALYGTTYAGGSGNGVVFRLTTNGIYNVLHTFAAGEGSGPLGGLLEGCDGSLYGSTSEGSGGGGVIFKLNKDGSSFTVLQTLALTVAQAQWTIGTLVDGHDGALYGATAFGGNAGGGTVFEMAYGWTFDWPVVESRCCGTNLGVILLGTVTNAIQCGQSITATWAVTDCCTNTSTCTQTVTVISGSGVFQCPSNIVVTSCTNIPVFFPATTAGNACCSNVTLSYLPPSGSLFAPGSTNLVQCVATDCCGHTNSCTFEVTVVSPTLGLTINRTQNTITLTWNGGGGLEQANNVTGPWTPVLGAVSPYTTPVNAAARFYRLLCQ